MKTLCPRSLTAVVADLSDHTASLERTTATIIHCKRTTDERKNSSTLLFVSLGYGVESVCVSVYLHVLTYENFVSDGKWILSGHCVTATLGDGRQRLWTYDVWKIPEQSKPTDSSSTTKYITITI